MWWTLLALSLFLNDVGCVLAQYTNPLPVSTSNPIVSLNKPIRVSPTSATCSNGATITVPSYSQTTQNTGQLVSCYATPCRTEKLNKTLIADEEFLVGQRQCTIPGFPGGNTGASYISSRYIRAVLLEPCFRDFNMPLPFVNKTLSFWFRLGSPKAFGTVLDYQTFILNVQNESLIMDARNGALLQGTGSWPIRSDAWINVVVRITHNASNYIYSIEVFINGIARAFYIYTTYQSQRDRRQAYLGPTFRVGLPISVAIDSSSCAVVEVDECRKSNSAFYWDSGRSPEEQELHYANFMADLNAVLTRCTNASRDDLVLYMCSYYFPGCLDTSVPKYPCQQFCQRILSACPALVSSPESTIFICSALSNSSQACVDQGNLDPGKLFEGSVKNIIIYEGILTDREILKDYNGTIITDIPRPECMCPESEPNSNITNRLYCSNWGVPLQGRVPSVYQDGIIQNDFLLEYMNDGSFLQYVNQRSDLPFTFWASSPGTELFTVEIDFQKMYTVTNVEIYTLTPLPKVGVTLQRQLDTGEWRDWHHFAADCRDLGFPSFFYKADRPDVVQCIPYMPNQIQNLSWQPTEGRNYTSQPYWTDIRGVEFQQSRGLRVKFNGLPQGGTRNYHGIVEIQVMGRERDYIPACVACYPDGSEARKSNCETQCPCLPHVNVTLAGKQCAPYIEQLYPTYGPQAGGTNIVILGGAFGNIPKVVTLRCETDAITCLVNNTLSNSSLIVCKTQPLANKTLHLLGEPLTIEINLGPGRYIINYHSPFIYKPNPNIRDIYPRKSMLFGGILQTVIGEHLDSVFKPIFIVYQRDYNIERALKGEVCTVKNSTWMTCPTPQISNEPNVRKRRAVRESRQTRNWLNNDIRDWYIGLILDGVPTYVNLSVSLPDQAQILIYTSPEISRFDPETMTFSVYKGDKTIDIEGTRLTYGVQDSDYHISIGDGTCKLTRLMNNLLTCEPPTSKPTADDYDINAGAIKTVVKIGETYVIYVGYLRYEVTVWDNPSARGGIIAMIVIVILLLLLAYPVYLLIKKLRDSSNAIEKQRSVQNNLYDNTPRNFLDYIDAELKAKVESCIVPYKYLSINEKTGEGNFGIVYRGKLEDAQGAHSVALKTIKGNEANIKELSEFLEEATVMKDFEHPNVLSLISIIINGPDANIDTETGISLRPSQVFVVMPFMENGALKGYLNNKENRFTVLDLLVITVEICKGMAYLESQKFVHRDLAARNCMVDGAKSIKIADFGLARDIYMTEYYTTQDKSRGVPYRWMAMECLSEQKFTSKSDVWSFGVLMWEIFTRCAFMPYSHIVLDYPSMFRYLHSGSRLQQPAACPSDVYQIMCSCWMKDASDRPTFKELEKHLLDIISPESDSPGYTRLSTFQRQESQYKEVYAYAELNAPPEYLVLVDTPVGDDLAVESTRDTTDEEGSSVCLVAQRSSPLPPPKPHTAANNSTTSLIKPGVPKPAPQMANRPKKPPPPAKPPLPSKPNITVKPLLSGANSAPSSYEKRDGKLEFIPLTTQTQENDDTGNYLTPGLGSYMQPL